MTKSYFDRLVGVSTSEHFESLLALIDQSQPARHSLLNRAKERLQIENAGATEQDIRGELDENPLEFYRLVSDFLADSPEGLLEIDRNRISDGLKITVEDYVEFLKITADGYWVRYLAFGSPAADLESNSLKISWLSPEGVETVPFSIYEFLRAAMACFRADHYPGAIALAAIAFEASLKEALRRANKHVIKDWRYKSARGQIDAYRENGEMRFKIHVKDATRGLHEYFNSKNESSKTGWLGNVKFRVRRNRNNEDNVEGPGFVLIPGDTEHAEVLASDNLEDTPKEREAKRFVQFNRLADEHGFFRTKVFSPETAEVLRQARNNIVHWDEEQIEKVLIGEVTLQDYIQDSRQVRTNLVDLAEFVSILFEDAAHSRARST